MSDPRSETNTRPRPFYTGTTAQQLRGKLKWQDQGHGTKIAEEDGRIYKIEFTGGSGSSKRNPFHTTATEKRTRRVIATKDTATSRDAQAWCETLRRPYAGASSRTEG